MSSNRPTLAVGYDELVQLIYDTVDAKEGITDALPEIAAWVGGRPGIRAQTIVIAKTGEVLENRSFGADPARFENYAVNWMDNDARMAAAQARPCVVLDDTRDIDREAFERSAVFNEALVIDDTVHSLFGNFAVEGDLILAQAFLRGRRDGPFDVENANRMRALLPHLRRATRLRHLVRELHELHDDVRLALDALPTAVAILDPNGKIVTANSSAEALLSRGGGHLVRGGKLTTPIPSEARELAAAIAKTSLFANAQSAAGSANLAATPVKLSRPAAEPLWVLLYPLRPRSSVRGAIGAARTLAVLHDPEARVRLPPELLTKIHALTPTEAALASALAEGRSLADFAEARGSSEETARTHLKRILEKTGTHRQADLVRVLLGTAALHSVK